MLDYQLNLKIHGTAVYVRCNPADIGDDVKIRNKRGEGKGEMIEYLKCW